MRARINLLLIGSQARIQSRIVYSIGFVVSQCRRASSVSGKGLLLETTGALSLKSADNLLTGLGIDKTGFEAVIGLLLLIAFGSSVFRAFATKQAELVVVLELEAAESTPLGSESLGRFPEELPGPGN